MRQTTLNEFMSNSDIDKNYIRLFKTYKLKNLGKINLIFQDLVNVD